MRSGRLILAAFFVTFSVFGQNFPPKIFTAVIQQKKISARNFPSLIDSLKQLRTINLDGYLHYNTDSIKSSNDTLFFHYSLKKIKPKIDSVIIISKPELPKNLYTYYINILRKKSFPANTVEDIYIINIHKFKIIKLNKKNTLFIHASYQPENTLEANINFNNQSSSKILGFINFSSENLLHAGEKIRIRYRKNIRAGDFLIQYTFPYLKGTPLLHKAGLYIHQQTDTFQTKANTALGVDYPRWQLYAGVTMARQNQNKIWLSAWEIKQKPTRHTGWSLALHAATQKIFVSWELNDRRTTRLFDLMSKINLKWQKGIDFDIFGPYPLEAIPYFRNNKIKKTFFHMNNTLIWAGKNVKPYLSHDFFFADFSTALPDFIGLISAGIYLDNEGNRLKIGLSIRDAKSKQIEYQGVRFIINYVLTWH